MACPLKLCLCICLLRFGQTGAAASKKYNTGLPPGHWNLEHKRWVSTDWTVKDLIGPPAPETDQTEPTAVHGVFFGDSNDRNIMNDFCLKEEPQAQPHGHTVQTFKSCWHRNLTLSWQALVGIHPTGPYWNGVTGTPYERLLHGLQKLHGQFEMPPDFLVIASNLWDLWHWGTSNVSLLDDKKIADHELSAWGLHLTSLLNEVEVGHTFIQLWKACTEVQMSAHSTTSCGSFTAALIHACYWCGTCEWHGRGLGEERRGSPLILHIFQNSQPQDQPLLS